MTALGMGRARAARDEAMERATIHAPEQWKRDARICVKALAVSRGMLTTDDVWSIIGQPREPRALGPVMLSAASRGTIVRTGEYRQSTRPECHCRPIPVWGAGPALAGAALRDARHALRDLEARYQVRAA